jgi:hypothetical protein
LRTDLAVKGPKVSGAPAAAEAAGLLGGRREGLKDLLAP